MKNRTLVYDILTKSITINSPPSSNFEVIYANKTGDIFTSEHDSRKKYISPLYKYEIASNRFIEICRCFKGFSEQAFFFHDDHLYSFGYVPKTHYSEVVALRFNFLKNRVEIPANVRDGYDDSKIMRFGFKQLQYDSENDLISIFDTRTRVYDEIITGREYNQLLTLDNSEEYLYQAFKNTYLKCSRDLSSISEIDLKFLFLDFEGYGNEYFVHNKQLFYFDSEEKLLAKLNFDLIHKKFKKRSKSHFVKHAGTRYMYTQTDSYDHICIDLKYMVAAKVPLNKFCEKEVKICELEDGLVLSEEWNKVLLYKPHKKHSKHISINKFKLRIISLVYNRSYIYAFDKDSVYRLELDCKECILHKSGIEFKRNEWVSCVSVNDKIIIIGGGNHSIDIYDIDRYNYYESGILLPSNYAVSKYIQGKLYVIFSNKYRIYDEGLNLLVEGQSHSREYCILSKGTVGFYDFKIYFMNREIGILEYFDTRSFKRGGEAIQMIKS